MILQQNKTTTIQCTLIVSSQGKLWSIFHKTYARFKTILPKWGPI